MKTVTIPPQAANQSLSKKLRVVLLALLVVGLVVIAAYVVPQPATTAPASSRAASGESQEALKTEELARHNPSNAMAPKGNAGNSGAAPSEIPQEDPHDALMMSEEWHWFAQSYLNKQNAEVPAQRQEGLKEWWLEQYGPKEMNSSQSQEGLKEWWLEQYGPRR